MQGFFPLTAAAVLFLKEKHKMCCIKLGSKGKQRNNMARLPVCILSFFFSLALLWVFFIKFYQIQHEARSYPHFFEERISVRSLFMRLDATPLRWVEKDRNIFMIMMKMMHTTIWIIILKKISRCGSSHSANALFKRLISS